MRIRVRFQWPVIIEVKRAEKPLVPGPPIYINRLLTRFVEDYHTQNTSFHHNASRPLRTPGTFELAKLSMGDKERLTHSYGARLLDAQLHGKELPPPPIGNSETITYPPTREERLLAEKPLNHEKIAVAGKRGAKAGLATRMKLMHIIRRRK